MLPLCHQTSETAVVQVYSGGGSKVGGGSKATPAQPHPQPLPEREGSGCAQGVAAESVVTSNDSPKLFTTVKTAFSCGENTVFQRRKRRLPAWQRTHLPSPLRAAAPLPFGEGLGVGLCCHLPPCCHHRYMSEPQRFRKAGGRVAAKTGKNFFMCDWQAEY